MRKSLLALSSLAIGLNIANAADLKDFASQFNNLKPHETATLGQEDNATLFNQYCVGNASGTEIPVPNYSNALVSQAAQKLSETKTSADNILKEMAKEQMASNISQTKELVSELVKNPNPEISDLANKLLTELASANSDGFTPNSQKLYEQMTLAYAKVITESASVLSANLPLELKGVDYAVFTNVINSLVTNLELELKRVDFKALKLALGELVEQLKAEPSNVSITAITDALTVLEKDFSKATDEQSKYLMTAIAELKKYLVSNPSGGVELMSYVSEVNYAVSYVTDANIALTPDSKSADKTLSDQVAYSRMAKVQKAVENAQKLLIGLDPDTSVEDYNKVKSLINNLTYTLNDVSDSLSETGKQTYSSYQNEVNKFQSEDIVKLSKLVQDRITKGENSSALATAQTLQYRIKAVEGLLSAETLALKAQLELQMSRRFTEEVLATIIELKNKADLAKGKLSVELIEAADGMASQLSSVLGLTSETKKAADIIVYLGNELYSVSELKNNLSASPDKKQSEHFYFYGGVTRLYGLNNTYVPTNAPQGTRPVAHIFLTQLCGEYRDRATMIEAKLKWATNIFILSKGTDKKFEIDISKNVWSQIPAAAYYPYLEMSAQVWEAKRDSLPRFMTIGENENIDTPVPGFTVCETKYIFSEYVGKEKEFDDFSSYSTGYASYKNGCSSEDQTDYYDFRGDSNYKHYSPESNGMIWYATSLAKACKDSNTVRDNQQGFTSDDCKNYFKNPFYYRYNAARAGLSAWLFRDDKYSSQFSEQGSMVAIYPHRTPQLLPYSFGFNLESTTDDMFGFDSKWLALSSEWHKSDIGFNSYLGLGQDGADLESAYNRLRDAVDRHTDWYSSGFNDKNGTAKEQAYSPFVASSYEMSESDNFTSCGITVQCPNDGLKRWMFIFRIKGQNWYNPERLKNNEVIDFDKMWFDETSFGVSNLADSEKAWDRLGTPMEDELDSILYLINVDLGDGGEE